MPVRIINYFNRIFFISMFIRIFMRVYNRLFFSIFILYYASLANAADITGIADIDSMLLNGQSMIRVAAKWGGILTVVAAALALGSGRLEGALSRLVCKILVVIGLLISAFTYFGYKISWGFAF